MAGKKHKSPLRRKTVPGDVAAKVQKMPDDAGRHLTRNPRVVRRPKNAVQPLAQARKEKQAYWIPIQGPNTTRCIDASEIAEPWVDAVNGMNKKPSNSKGCRIKVWPPTVF